MGGTWKWAMVGIALLIAFGAALRVASRREVGRPESQDASNDRAPGSVRPGHPAAGGMLPPAPTDDAEGPTTDERPSPSPTPGIAGSPSFTEAEDPEATESAHGPDGDAADVEEPPYDGEDGAATSGGKGTPASKPKLPSRGTARIFGTVLGKDGLPVRLVLVSARREEDGGVLDRKPNEKGEYQAMSLAGGTYVVTCAVKGQAVLTRRIDLAEGEEKRVDFSVASGTRLFGWVSRGGRPVADTQLVFAPEHGADVTATFAATDAQGNYEVRGVPPGAVMGRVGNHDHRIWVPEGLDELRCDIALPEGIVAGHVYGGRGRAPAKGAKVDVYRVGDPRGDLAQHAARWVTGAEADVDGRYEAKGVTGGRYMLHVSHPEYGLRVHGPVDVPEGGAAEGIDLYLGDPGHLVVFVVDQDWKPIEKAVITIRDAATGEPLLLPQERREATDLGAYILKGVPAGEYRVTAHARGCAQATQRARIANGVERVEFRLAEEARLKVHVRDSSGQPVEHAVLVLWDAAGEPVDPTPGDWDDPSRSQTDTDGALLRGGLGSGTYQAEVASALGRARFQFEAEEGKTTEVEVTVQPVPEEER